MDTMPTLSRVRQRGEVTQQRDAALARGPPWLVIGIR
jgi:hypothetical protein